jgi:hypothetical protein
VNATRYFSFDVNESAYLCVADGGQLGTEFAWLPLSKQLAWHNRDGHTNGFCDGVTLIESSADGDESGLNSAPNLIACDLDGNCGLWVLAGCGLDLDGLPDDARVCEFDENGLREIELEDEAGPAGKE